ncbi:hypothetical protein [Luteimonas sp. R10]|uniref:hypothetical protein n=1 Tax=Luteimonas sp. R10 TaxID=3108176 RepID=UPI00308F2D35|nr:hypothetical protein U3649_00325 [Luteimonas sp. R10]
MRRNSIQCALAAACMLLPVAAGGAAERAAPDCTEAAIAQAGKLLAFHVDGDDRASVEPEVTALPSTENPAAANQLLAVLEVWGNVYKGRYRMRLLYGGQGETACTLMGQEILEYARL